MSKCISCNTVLTADNTDDGEICHPCDAQEQLAWNDFAQSVGHLNARERQLVEL